MGADYAPKIPAKLVLDVPRKRFVVRRTKGVDGRALELSTSEASGFFSYETFSEKTFQMVPADEPSTPTTCKLTYSTGNLADPSNPVLGIFLDVGDSNGNGDHAKFNFAGMPEGSTGNHPTKRIEVLAAFKQPIQDGSTLTERAEFGSTIAIDSVTYAAGKLIVQRKHETSDEIDEMTITTTPNLETVSEVHYTRARRRKRTSPTSSARR